MAEQQAVTSFRSYSLISRGWQAQLIQVEVRLLFGQPKFQIIGLASQVVNESRLRITAALQSCGVRIKARKTIVNLAPVSLKKTASHLDLAVAVALLESNALIPQIFNDSIFLGELGLDGQLKAVDQIFALVLAAKELGFKRIFLPRAQLKLLQGINKIEIYPLESLQELIAYATNQKRLFPHKIEQEILPESQENDQLSLAAILGQRHAKRALQLTALGHHLLLIGPPGVGKTLLADSLRQLLPPLSKNEFLEVNRIYSLAGINQNDLLKRRSFRSLTARISKTDLLGDAKSSNPGEITLAHRGVLFLDEIAEFSKSKLDCLKSPLDRQLVTLRDDKQIFSYPAAFTLVATSNPCPCGLLDSKKACRCSTAEIHHYRKRLTAALLDRFDLILRINDLRDLANISIDKKNNYLSEFKQMKKQVTQAREKQRERLIKAKLEENINLERRPDLVEILSPLDVEAKKTLKKAVTALNLSTRVYFKLIRVAQSIVDLDQKEKIGPNEIMEALSYRQSF